MNQVLTEARDHLFGTIPEGWTRSILEEIGEWRTGGTPSRKVAAYFGGGIPWVKSGDLNDGIVKETEETLSAEGIKRSSAKILPKGTVSIALYGATIGKLGVLGIDAATNQACANCQVDSRIVDKWFVFYYLLGQRQALIDAGQGGAQPNLTNGIVRLWPVLLPPLAEQKRIVAKVEELLARVNAARERLARVPAILKRFRQSVLAAACSGRLTADWREGQASLEPAEDLLHRLRQDHESNGFGHGGKAADPTEEAHTLSRQEVPNEWDIAELRMLCKPGRPITYGILKPGPHISEGVPYIRVADFPNDRLELSTIRCTSDRIASQYQRSSLEDGDVLLSIRGTVGRTCRVPTSLKGANITQDTARISVHPEVSPDYVQLCLRAPGTQDRMKRAIKGVAVRGINIGDVRVLQIPLPSLAEQREIFRRVESLFHLADTIEKRTATARQRVEKLTQAILAKAFRGELVPTETELARQEGRDYEPASVLLERIRAGCDQSKTVRKPRRQRETN